MENSISNDAVRVQFYEQAEDEKLRFAVIIARYKELWIFCRHRERSTWECPGGHREAGESVEKTAARELYEETGALSYTLYPMGYYAVEKAEEQSFGALFYAEVETLGELPISEIAEVALLEKEPESWTYPDIQPQLMAYIRQNVAFNIR